MKRYYAFNEFLIDIKKYFSKDYYRHIAFRLWKKKQWKNYFKNHNYDFDYASFLYLMELKLTLMGLTFRHNALVEDYKTKVRSIWRARKYLRAVIKSEDTSEENDRLEMIRVFGQELDVNFSFTPKFTTVYSTKTPVSKETLAEMEAVHTKMILSQWERTKIIESDNLNKFVKELNENMTSWWD